MQFAVSRKREYLADASGVQLTRYPPGLISALEKLQGDTTSIHSASKATAHLWIEEPLDKDEQGPDRLEPPVRHAPAARRPHPRAAGDVKGMNLLMAGLRRNAACESAGAHQRVVVLVVIAACMRRRRQEGREARSRGNDHDDEPEGRRRVAPLTGLPDPTDESRQAVRPSR